MTSPKAFVACKKCYEVQGRLIGKWVDTCQDLATIQTNIEQVMDSSPYKSEEWYVVLYNQSFYGLDKLLGKTPDLKLLSRISQGIEEYGESFALYLKTKKTLDKDKDYLEEYQDNFLGEANSKEQFAEAYFSTWYEDVTDIDWKAVARKMFKDLSVIKSKETKQIFVFTK